MTVKEYYEDIFESPAQTLVCPCNVIGAMGKGLALQFKERVPGLYTRYRQLCHKGKFTVDQLWRYPWPESDKQVLCFPTKWHWKNPSRLGDVTRNLRKLVELHEQFGITSLAIPPVGCGLGGLSYEHEVRKEMFEILERLPFEVRIVLGDPKHGT